MDAADFVYRGDSRAPLRSARNDSKHHPLTPSPTHPITLIAVLCALGVLAVHPIGAQETPRPLTHDGKRKEDLSWSREGRLACSYYYQNGKIGIAVIEPGGGTPRVITPDPAQNPVERAPSWSADGKRLTFVHVTQSGTDGELDIWQMNAEGGDRKPLMAEKKAFENSPSWSPDGKKLLWTTTKDKTQEIYVADADGANPKRLTTDASLKQYPSWSPDGKQILFNSNRDGNFDLYVMDADGTHLKRLTTDPSTDVCGAWSPDGKRIAFVSMRDGNPEVYVMNADGSGARNVSQSPAYDFFPAWMPDGKTLTWVSERSGRQEVYAVVP